MCVDATLALVLASTVACATDHVHRAEALARQLHAQNLYNVPASFAWAVHDVCEGRLPVERRDAGGFPELEGLEGPDEEDCDLEPEASVPGLAWGDSSVARAHPARSPSPRSVKILSEAQRSIAPSRISRCFAREWRPCKESCSSPSLGPASSTLERLDPRLSLLFRAIAPATVSW